MDELLKKQEETFERMAFKLSEEREILIARLYTEKQKKKKGAGK